MDTCYTYGPLHTNLWCTHFTMFELTDGLWQKETSSWQKYWTEYVLEKHRTGDTVVLLICKVEDAMSHMSVPYCLQLVQCWMHTMAKYYSL